MCVGGGDKVSCTGIVQSMVGEECMLFGSASGVSVGSADQGAPPNICR